MTVSNIRDFISLKGERPLVCLTAYTYYMAGLIAPSTDLILVGDSLGMVQYGMRTTVPVTLEMMAYHGEAVVNGAPDSLVVVDLPFGSYQESPEQAFHSSSQILKLTGCAAVKLEGGQEMAQTIEYLTKRGVPVLAHIGLKPQSVHAHGGYRMIGKTGDEAGLVMADAIAVAEAGAFGMVIECVDSALAAKITKKVTVPTIGIGASNDCDGQILVTEDLLGMTGSKVPGFVKQYTKLHKEISVAVDKYKQDVLSRSSN